MPGVVPLHGLAKYCTNCGKQDSSIVFTKRILGFSVVKIDGSRTLDTTFSGGGGLRQTLSHLEYISYSINLVDATFELPWFLTIIVTVDHIWAS